jgi:hypothetical protein
MTDRPCEAGEQGEDHLVPTRRQFLVALGGTTLAAAAYGYGGRATEQSNTKRSGSTGYSARQDRVAAATAVAEAVYPPSVPVDESFIETRVFGRIEPKPGHFDGLAAAIDTVDGYARARFGGSVTALSPGRRRGVLQSMGVTTVHPTADGTAAERVRYYLVNDLLYALFTSPLSSEWTGVDNPPGHPGGRDAYRRPLGGGDR